jgi:hypothetical protein
VKRRVEESKGASGRGERVEEMQAFLSLAALFSRAEGREQKDADETVLHCSVEKTRRAETAGTRGKKRAMRFSYTSLCVLLSRASLCIPALKT